MEPKQLQHDANSQFSTLVQLKDIHSKQKHQKCWPQRLNTLWTKYSIPYILLCSLCLIFVKYMPKLGSIVAVVFPTIFLIFALFYMAFKYNKTASAHKFVPIKWMFLFVLLGILQVFAGFYVNTYFNQAFQKMFGAPSRPIISALIVPIVEENCKYWTVFWIVLKSVDKLKIARNPASVIVYAVIAGQIFGTIEDFFYSGMCVFDASSKFCISPAFNTVNPQATQVIAEDGTMNNEMIVQMSVRILFPLHAIFGAFHAIFLAYFTKFNTTGIRPDDGSASGRRGSLSKVIMQYPKVVTVPILFHVLWNGMGVFLQRFSVFLWLPYCILISWCALHFYEKYFALWGKQLETPCPSSSQPEETEVVIK